MESALQRTCGRRTGLAAYRSRARPINVGAAGGEGASGQETNRRFDALDARGARMSLSDISETARAACHLGRTVAALFLWSVECACVVYLWTAQGPGLGSHVTPGAFSAGSGRAIF